MANPNSEQIIADIEATRQKNARQRSEEISAVVDELRVGHQQAEERIGKYNKWREHQKELAKKDIGYESDNFLNPEPTAAEELFYIYLKGKGKPSVVASANWPMEVFGSVKPAYIRNYIKEYENVLGRGGRLGVSKISFITKFTRFYFVVGFVGLILAWIDNPGFAAYTFVYWLILGIGLGLVSYGEDSEGKQLAKMFKVVGWIWIAFFFLSVSVANNPALQ